MKLSGRTPLPTWSRTDAIYAVSVFDACRSPPMACRSDFGRSLLYCTAAIARERPRPDFSARFFIRFPTRPDCGRLWIEGGHADAAARIHPWDRWSGGVGAFGGGPTARVCEC